VTALNDAGQILGQAYDGAQVSNIVVLTPTTTAGTTVPAAPTNLVATAPSTRRVHLAWTDNATNETGYTVERCKGSTCTAFAKVASLGANATAYDDTSVRSGTTYRYRVVAVNSAGRSVSAAVSIVAR
jgi:fibronectin type 3 domain-containing protein